MTKIATRLGAHRRRQLEAYADAEEIPFRVAVRRAVEAGLETDPPPPGRVADRSTADAGRTIVTTRVTAHLAEQVKTFASRNRLEHSTALRRLVAAGLTHQPESAQP